MSEGRFKKDDLVVLNGYATVEARHGNMHKPIPLGTMGYVLTTYCQTGFHGLADFYEALVRFDGYGPAITVLEDRLLPASALDQLVREV